MATPIQPEAAPSKATDAVLKPSEFSTTDATEVTGVDFNNYASRNITVAELVDNMSTMGFQATSVGEAVKLVNKMVRPSKYFYATREKRCT
jgi:deoxyhypusine synthase